MQAELASTQKAAAAALARVAELRAKLEVQ
jgi:hypothetical protein